MLRKVEISFSSEEYNTYNLDKGKEEIIKDEVIQITLTTIKIQKNNYDANNNNMTLIDLEDYETLLREVNRIPEEELLYIRKIDIYQKGIKIQKTEFEVYYKGNNTK